MSLVNGLLGLLDRISPPRVAEAHCDIPCGIYDPHAAQVAAHTVIRMVQLMQGLESPGQGASKDQALAFPNSMERYIAVKEEHAKLVEHELTVLWTDYFKPEHLEQHPNLHDLFWKTMKLTSTVKQQVSMEASQQLLAGCQEVAEIFWKTKGVETKRRASNQPTGGEIVGPA